MTYNRRSILSLILALAAVAAIGSGQSPSNRPLSVTVLYDNTAHRQECSADWGFACLVEGTDKVILFDAGTKGDILLKNVETLKTDLSKVGAVVISHAHLDHTGGLSAVLPKMPGVTVHLPSSSPPALVEAVRQAGGVVSISKDPAPVCGNVWLTGELGDQIVEQSLVIRTPGGMVVLTGCSHPGIVKILERAKEVGKDRLYAVMGGFHLLQHGDAAVQEIVARVRELGIAKVGASHCTGEKAIGAFRKTYGPNFIELGAGQVVRLNSTQ